MSKYEVALKNWKSLMSYFATSADEKDLDSLLKQELAKGKRVSFAMRIYGRYSELRMQRERKQIFKALGQ